MLEYFEKKTNIENPNLIKFKWRKKKLEKDKAKTPETGKVNFFAKYRDGGEGFIAWCEENVHLAIYKEGATVPTWMPMSELPDTPNPDTGRSYKQMWESQKEIVREALRMENGRFVYRLIVLCWQRGDGKSLLACLFQLWKFFCFPKQQIMLGANSKDQVKFVHYDIMKEIILNSPKLVKIIGRKNLQEKEMRLVDNQKRVISIVRSISSFSGIVSNITGYTFSEIFDMKNPKFFVQLDGSIRNIPNAMGVIDSTISEKTHILYQLYQNSLEDTNSSVYFSYRCSPKGIHEDFMNPQMTQRQLDEYKRKFPPAEFARYFKNTWDTGVKKVFTDAQLEAMHYIGLKGISLQDPTCQMKLIKMLEEKNDKKTELEQKNKEAILGPEFQSFLKQIDDAVIHMSDVFTLDTNDYFCEMATKRELDKLEDIYDTYWCVGIGIDRADPLKNKVDYFEEQDKTKRKRTTGARTMMVYIAKGLIGSRSNPLVYMDVDAVHKYIYVILSVKHCNTSTIEEMKNEINSAETEYGDIDAICSERWGMFDIVTWCDEKNIPLELISPTTDKQKEAFGELYLAVANGRVKVPHIGYYGTRKKDILMEEMEILESDSDKIWYGSPEKNKSDGIKDDTCFALVWGIYGLRFKTVDDMKPRTTTTFMGQFIPNAGLHGNY